MLNFDFLEKGLGLVSPPYFVYDFSKKKYFMCFVLLTDQISLSDCLCFFEILVNMCIVIICFPVYDTMNFEINLSFLIKPFFNMTKKSGQKCNYLKKEKSF